MDNIEVDVGSEVIFGARRGSVPGACVVCVVGWHQHQRAGRQAACLCASIHLAQQQHVFFWLLFVCVHAAAPLMPRMLLLLLSCCCR